MKSVYILEVNDAYRFHSGMDFIRGNFNSSRTIVTLNTIREVFGLKPIRAEYEMCFGPDTEKPLDISATYNFSTEMSMDSTKVPYHVKVSNVVDLRHYYECDEDGSDYYDQ